MSAEIVILPMLHDALYVCEYYHTSLDNILKIGNCWPASGRIKIRETGKGYFACPKHIEMYKGSGEVSQVDIFEYSQPEVEEP